MSRREEYFNFLFSNGKNINDLPTPVAPEDFPLYDACINGFGMENKAEGYYNCLVSSGSSEFNFLNCFLNLGEKRAATAKVRARVKLRTGGNEVPTQLSLRLFANNSSARDVITDYRADSPVLFSNAIADTEYILEHTFTTTPASGVAAELTLDKYQYLKPFVLLSKTSKALSTKHIVDIYEFTIEVNGVIYDILDTIEDFDAQTVSRITYISNSISSDSIHRKNLPWFGKTIACLGDSITWGYQSGGNGSTRENNPWIKQLKSKCGFLNAKNYGISGNKFSGVNGQYQPMSARFNTIEENVDVITVMGGINDVAGKIPLGVFNATDSSLDVNTFYGAVQTTLKGLKERYPGKPIVVMLPLTGDNVNSQAAATALGLTVEQTVEQYREVIRVCANHYGLYILDLPNLVGFNVGDETDKTTYMPDGVHPNQAGHDRMAQVISEYLNKLA